MIAQLDAELPGTGWRGWYFWRVTMGGGGFDPVTVSTKWSMQHVVDAALGLALREVLESL